VESSGAYWSTYGTRLAVLGIGFLVGIVSARGLGPAGRGVYAATVTSAALIVQLGNFGLSSAVLYFVSRRQQRGSAFLALSWAAGAVLLGLCMLTYAILRWRGHAPSGSFLVALWAPAQLTALLQEQVFLGLKRFHQYNALQLAGRSLGLLGALCAVWLRAGDPLTFLASQLLADVIPLVVGLVLLLSAGLGKGTHTIAAGPVARLAARAAPALVIPFLLVRSDILLMQAFRGSVETGIYSVAAQLIDVLLLLPASFARILFVSLARSRDPAGETARTGRQVLGLLALLAALMGASGPWAIPLVFGLRYSTSYGPMLVLLPGAVLLGLQTIVGQFFGMRGYPGFLTAYWLVGLAINLGINLYAIPRFGAMGAAAASSAGYTVVSCLVLGRFTRAAGFPLRSLWTKQPESRSGKGVE
jgi:O-antigen/teichoic acid export membrane protein